MYSAIAEWLAMTSSKWSSFGPIIRASILFFVPNFDSFILFSKTSFALNLLYYKDILMRFYTPMSSIIDSIQYFFYNIRIILISDFSRHMLSTMYTLYIFVMVCPTSTFLLSDCDLVTLNYHNVRWVTWDLTSSGFDFIIYWALLGLGISHLMVFIHKLRTVP